MNRIVTAAVAAAVLLVAAPAAIAKAPTPRHRGVYLYLRRHVIKADGLRAAGRNIVLYGLRGGRPATDARVVASNRVYIRLLWPPPAPELSSPTASPPAYAATGTRTATTSSGYSGAVPACASESGTNYSTGPANTNPSGATGRYQIIPSTAQAYGCDLSTPAGQDACAARIYAGQGASAWVGCGG